MRRILTESEEDGRFKLGSARAKAQRLEVLGVFCSLVCRGEGVEMRQEKLTGADHEGPRVPIPGDQALFPGYWGAKDGCGAAE